MSVDYKVHFVVVAYVCFGGCLGLVLLFGFGAVAFLFA